MRIPMALLLVVASASAQNTAVRVTSVFKTGARYAGVWGYVAPDGREFALVGERSGLEVVETTDPANPIRRGFFTAPASNWREITSYGPFVYSCSEAHAGVRVVDMTNPSSPQDLGNAQIALFIRSHSISVDPDLGHVYVNGASGAQTGMHVLDARTNPRTLPQLARFTLEYVHDSHIRRGTAYLAEINRGFLRILDVQNLAQINQPAATLSRFQTVGSFTHSAWVSDDDRLLIVTDENNWGVLQTYDITDKRNPVLRGTYGTNGHIVHNIFMLGPSAHIAHNSEGYHFVDLTDPANVRKLANWDTSPHGPGTGYTGMWGCYPFQESGIVYGTDREEGLFCFEVQVGHLNRYGNGTANGSGRVPRAEITRATPRVGAAGFALRVTGLAPNARFSLFVSSGPGSTRILGVDVLLDLSFLLGVDGTADGSGVAVVPLGLPQDPGLANLRVYAQVVALDPTGPQGMTASRGMWFGIAP
jgi:choice-of-anchor B domain-containing protein